MTTVREKAARDRGIVGESGLGEAPNSRRGLFEEGGEAGKRRAGILLVVIGCALMALAAGESLVVEFVAVRELVAQASSLLAP